MALITSDRVLSTTASPPGTSATVTLSPTQVTGYDTIQTAMAVGDTCYYTIVDQSGGNWEVGLGTYSSSNTLTRTTLFSSSNGNTTTNFSSGVQNVFIDYPAKRAVHQARSLVYQMVFSL